jgi:hypothetical protein
LVISAACAASTTRRWSSQWVKNRQAELLEMPYFHVVFAVPDLIATIAFQNQTVVYDILFRAASETLRTIAANPEHLGAEIGFFGVLHTWGQNLLHHPHIHFLVPGGGIVPDGHHWIACRPGFFLPVRVLSRMFRGLFLRDLEKAFTAGELHFFSAHRHLHEPSAFGRYLAPAWNANWVVYAKRPFDGPEQFLDYVGRYRHRVAISNNRLVSMDDGKVRFHWKDYRDDNRRKTMSLPAAEFIRRFLIHVLPDGFHRIHYFGFLSNCHRAQKLALCRELLGMARAEPAADPPADYRERFEALTGLSLRAWRLGRTANPPERVSSRLCRFKHRGRGRRHGGPFYARMKAPLTRGNRTPSVDLPLGRPRGRAQQAAPNEGSHTGGREKLQAEAR